MRIRLTLRADKRSEIPINYQYLLSSAIYKILSNSSPQYSTFLHDKGYMGHDGKPRKLFTFSFLKFKPIMKPVKGRIPIQMNSIAELIVSSPMLEDFIQHFVLGLFVNQRMKLQDTIFFIEQVETVASPEFKDEMKFKCLSPIVVSTQIDTTDGLKTYYYRPLDQKLSEAVRSSLIKKYETIYKRPPEEDQLEFQIDNNYIKKKGGERNISKLVTLRQGYPDETKIKGFFAPFTLSGSTELIQTAWDCGIGDKCSMGFGCVDMVK